jgi:hypothetical protein
MAQKNPSELEVHAPVEESDVPRPLKALVFGMVIVLLATLATVGIMLNQTGLLQLFYGR